jgi:hypothetical protein
LMTAMVDGSMALGGSITISSGAGMAKSSGSVAVSTSNTGTAGVSGDLSLNTGTASIGDSGPLDTRSGLSVSGSGRSIAISVGLGTGIGGAFSAAAGDLPGAAGGDASIYFWIVIDQQWRELDSGLRRWDMGTV